MRHGWSPGSARSLYSPLYIGSATDIQMVAGAEVETVRDMLHRLSEAAWDGEFGGSVVAQLG